MITERSKTFGACVICGGNTLYDSHNGRYRKCCSRKCLKVCKREQRKGTVCSATMREKVRKIMTGKKLSLKTKKKLGAISRFRWQGYSPEEKQGLINKMKLLFGEKARNWKGGRMGKNGEYIKIYSPTHPFSVCNHICEHRLVMEKFIGRHLTPNEVVHHINNNRSDNRIENLMLFSSRADHVRHHWAYRRLTREVVNA